MGIYAGSNSLPEWWNMVWNVFEIRNKDAAWAWIKTMTSNEDYLVNGLANTWGDFPGYIPAIERCIEEGHTDIVTGDQQYFADFYETAKNVKGDPMTKYDRQAWASATAQMDLIATGQTTPEEAVEGFKEEMKIFIRKSKSINF